MCTWQFELPEDKSPSEFRGTNCMVSIWSSTGDITSNQKGFANHKKGSTAEIESFNIYTAHNR